MRSMVSGIIFAISLPLIVTTSFAAETYQLDPNHTFVEWRINHFGYSNPAGKWSAEGTLTTDAKKPQETKLNAKIDVGHFITGIPKLDEHLSGPDFFDVEKYPSATFVSNKVVMTGKDSADVSGTLTLHGISKSVTLKVKLNKYAENPMNHKLTAGFSASTTINRSDFGINKYLPHLSDKVQIHIEAEAQRK